MPDKTYPRKQRVVAVGKMGSDKKHHRICSQHPEIVDEAGVIRPAPPKPGIVLAVGVPTEIDIVDARHEEVLTWDKELKFLDAQEDAKEPEPPRSYEDPPPAPVDVVPPAKGKKR